MAAAPPGVLPGLRHYARGGEEVLMVRPGSGIEYLGEDGEQLNHLSSSCICLSAGSTLGGGCAAMIGFQGAEPHD